MLSYNDLFEYLRKEKYGEQLQKLPNDFISDFSEFMSEMRKTFSSSDDLFSEDSLRAKKQHENSMAIFKELMLKRKKKILNLVFIAAETGIMKKDFEDMIYFEKDLFEKLVEKVSSADKELTKLMTGNGKKIKSSEKVSEKVSEKKIKILEGVEEFVGLDGKAVGPFEKEAIAELDSQVAEILIGSGKAEAI
jgi:DNA replication initiation complex subunit (GINS family)